MKTAIELNSKARESMLPEESVEWIGVADAFPLVNPQSKKGLSLRWILCAALFAVITVAYVILALQTVGFNYVVELVILFVFAYVAISPILDRNKLLKKCRYCVTNRRVMCSIGDNEVHSLGKAGLKIRAVPAENGCVHLLFGAAGTLPENKYMLKAITGVRSGDGDSITGIVFYNVKDSKELRDLPNY